MGRFDKYVNKEAGKKSAKLISKSSLDIWETLREESPLIKYSLSIGKIFFILPPIKKLSILISRKIFGKYENYRTGDVEFEENVSKAIFGVLYFTLILFLLFLKESASMALIVLLLGIMMAYYNFTTLKKSILIDVSKTVEIFSDEVLTFLSWMILLLAAGMNLSLALEYYTNEEKGKLSKIVEGELSKASAGKISMDVALAELAMNLNRDDLKEIFTLILQSKKLGVPIKNSLETYLEHYQDRLLSTAEKKGASANQKATFMLTFEVFLLMIYFLIGMIGSLLTGGLF